MHVALSWEPRLEMGAHFSAAAGGACVYHKYHLLVSQITRMHQIFRCIYTRYTGTLYIARKSLVVLLLALKMVEYS